MEITRDVIALREQGTRLTDIRAAIDRKYGASYGPSTPTPLPPEGL